MNVMNPPVRLLFAFQNLYDKSADQMIKVDQRDMWALADIAPIHDFTVHAPDLEAHTRFDLRSARDFRTTTQRPLPSWARSIAGVAWCMSQDGIPMVGGNFVLMGDEPAGPRYEYAMGMAFASVWYAYYQMPYDCDRVIALMERFHKSMG
jgi:hypothetical protein